MTSFEECCMDPRHPAHQLRMPFPVQQTCLEIATDRDLNSIHGAWGSADLQIVRFCKLSQPQASCRQMCHQNSPLLVGRDFSSFLFHGGESW